MRDKSSEKESWSERELRIIDLYLNEKNIYFVLKIESIPRWKIKNLRGSTILNLLVLIFLLNKNKSLIMVLDIWPNKNSI